MSVMQESKELLKKIIRTAVATDSVPDFVIKMRHDLQETPYIVAAKSANNIMLLVLGGVHISDKHSLEAALNEIGAPPAWSDLYEHKKILIYVNSRTIDALRSKLFSTGLGQNYVLHNMFKEALIRLQSAIKHEMLHDKQTQHVGRDTVINNRIKGAKPHHLFDTDGTNRLSKYEINAYAQSAASDLLLYVTDILKLKKKPKASPLAHELGLPAAVKPDQYLAHILAETVYLIQMYWKAGKHVKKTYISQIIRYIKKDNDFKPGVKKLAIAALKVLAGMVNKEGRVKGSYSFESANKLAEKIHQKLKHTIQRG